MKEQVLFYNSFCIDYEKSTAGISNTFLFSDAPDEEEQDDDILWLFTHTTPWVDVLTKWGCTQSQREKYMAKGIYSYTARFPALELDHGWELVCIYYFRRIIYMLGFLY